MECPQCHYPAIPDGTRFCPNCGQTLPAGAGKTTVIQVSQDIGEVGQGAQVTGASIGKIEGNVIIATDDAAQAHARRNLRLLLDKVQNYWVKGVLPASLQGAVLLDIPNQPRPDLIENPLEIPSSSSIDNTSVHGQPLPVKKVSEWFDEMDRALLVLDGAGSGKTISLLTLARDLTQRAAGDPIQPIPVVLHLASWSHKKQPLADWVVEELNVRYQIPIKFGRQWLEEGNLGLLLDGLDEVDASSIDDCIKVINRFRHENGLVPLVVCCRTEMYTAAQVELKFGGAVVLQPLTDNQIEQYLASFNPGAQAIRLALQEDVSLMQLARSPLMLNTLRVAYQNLPSDAIKSAQFDQPEERRRYLVDAYVSRCFIPASGSSVKPGQKDQLARLLSWLAVNLVRQNQGGFWIEQLQPGWLAGKIQGWIYWLLSRGLGGLLLGALLASTAEVASTYPGRAAYAICGALAGCLIGLIDGLRSEFSPAAPPPANPHREWAPRAVYTLATGLAAGGIYWLVFAQILHIGAESLRLGAGTALAFGLVFGAAGWRPDPQTDVRSAEALSWSFHEARRGLLPGLVLGVMAVVVTGLIFARSNPLTIWLTFGITYAVLGFVGIVLIFGLRGKQVEGKSFPNQGIWLSARNALRAGMTMGAVAGATYSIGYGLLPGAVLALRVGFLMMLIYGLLDVLKHACLRLILNLSERVPWRLARALDLCAALGFLNKAGGGYLFANRLVQDYFAMQAMADLTPEERKMNNDDGSGNKK